MCQCVLCDCWWLNYCGILNAGYYEAHVCCSFWLCMPGEMKAIDHDCIKLGFVGCGTNTFCIGSVCFATQKIKMYSRIKDTLDIFK